MLKSHHSYSFRPIVFVCLVLMISPIRAMEPDSAADSESATLLNTNSSTEIAVSSVEKKNDTESSADPCSKAGAKQLGSNSTGAISCQGEDGHTFFVPRGSLDERKKNLSDYEAQVFNGFLDPKSKIGIDKYDVGKQTTFQKNEALDNAALVADPNKGSDTANKYQLVLAGNSSNACDNIDQQVQQCRELGSTTVSTCDPKTNQDLAQFSQGMGGLNKMLAAAAASGSFNKQAACAMSAGTNALAGLTVGDYGDSCQNEVSNCRRLCEEGINYLRDNATVIQQMCATKGAAAQKTFDRVYEKCSVSSVETQAIKAAQGLGSNAMAGVKCAADGGAKSDACLQNPVQCMFGDANCNNPTAMNSNPVCFCKYKNPNDPMCAILSKLEDNPTQDFSKSSILSSDKYKEAELPLSADPGSNVDAATAALEELLAKQQHGPVGNVELQGKSGDGLGGSSGSVTGSSNGAAAGARGPASSGKDPTKVLAGFMSASSFGMSSVTGKESYPPNHMHRKSKYLRRLGLRHPKMPVDQMLSLAHRLARRDAEIWNRLHQARQEGASEEKIQALRAVLETQLDLQETIRLPSASSFKQEKKHEEESLGYWAQLWKDLINFYQYHAFQAQMYWNKWDQYPLEALLYGILALVPFAFLRAMGWILLPLIQAKRSAAGAESEKALRKNPITQILFTPEEQSYAKRRFERYMATYQKDLAEGKITLKTHPNPPWKPADAHYSVIKFYLEKDRHFRKVLLAQKKQELKSEEKKKMFFLSSDKKIQELQSSIQELLYLQEAYGDHEEFTAKDFQFEWIEDALFARREKFEPKAQQPMPLHFHKHFPLPAVIPANSSVLKMHAQSLGLLSSKEVHHQAKSVRPIA